MALTEQTETNRKSEADTGPCADEAPAGAPTIYVCVTCRKAGDPDTEPRPGALLADATASAARGSGVTVRRVRCLANCTRGPSAAMRVNGSWTYVFGGLDVEG